MLSAAFYILAIAVVVGSILAVMHFAKTGTALPPWPLAALHTALALGGFGLLLLALQGPPRGAAQGTAAFGNIAAALFVVAALFGGGLLAGRLRRQPPSTTLIGLHAMMAVTGFVILMAYVLS